MMNDRLDISRCARCLRAALLTCLVCMSAITTVTAQQLVPPPAQTQTAPTAPVVVDVRGMADVLGALQRVERKLDRLLDSRWEYRFMQRNRLRDQDEDIRSLGEQGWELVNVTVEEGFIFKRRDGALR